MINEAKIINKYLGIPFQHKGRTLSGLDCYGLVIKIYEDLGYEIFDLENYEERWFEGKSNYFVENYHKQWAMVSYPKLFDVVLFKHNSAVNHCGIVLSGGKFLHSSRKTKGVIVSRILSRGWSDVIEGFYRLKERE